MTSLKKVSVSYAALVERGLVDAAWAHRAAAVTALLPTLSEPGSTLSVDDMRAATGLAVAEVAEQLDHLASLGFAIGSREDAGVRLTRPFDGLLVPEAVVPLLLAARERAQSDILGLPYLYRASCESTNLLLKAEADSLPAGALLVTDEQTQGRGRLGRSWSSGPGEDLTFSVLLRPSVSPEEAPVLSLATALAVAEVLELLPGLEGRVWVKWPNDVLVDHRKVCGILLESCLGGGDLKWVVAGIGLNVNSDPQALIAALSAEESREWRNRPQPTSLKVETGSELPRGRLLVDLLARLQARWSHTGREQLLDGLRAHDALFGRRVEVYAGPPDGTLLATGKAVGLGSRGELLVMTANGETVPVTAGEVSVHVDSPAA